MYLQLSNENAMADNAIKSEIISLKEAEVQAHVATIAEYKAKIMDDEMTRRKLHNTIQELRGQGARCGSCWNSRWVGFFFFFFFFFLNLGAKVKMQG